MPVKECEILICDITRKECDFEGECFDNILTKEECPHYRQYLKSIGILQD